MTSVDDVIDEDRLLGSKETRKVPKRYSTYAADRPTRQPRHILSILPEGLSKVTANGIKQEYSRLLIKGNRDFPPSLATPHSSRLQPCGREADQTAHGSGQANNAVVEVYKTNGAARNGDIAHVGQKLQFSCSLFPVVLTQTSVKRATTCLANNNIPLHFLPLDSLLRIRASLALLLRQQLQVVQRVQTRGNVARQTREPRTVSLPLQPCTVLELADTSLIQVGQSIEGEVDGIAELTAHGEVLEHRV